MRLFADAPFFLLWFGAAVSLDEILAGTPLGLMRGLVAIIVGHVVGTTLLVLGGLIGTRQRQSAIGTTRRHCWPSTAASSRPSTAAIATSPAPKLSGVSSRLRPVSPATCQNSKVQIARDEAILPRPERQGFGTRSTPCNWKCSACRQRRRLWKQRRIIRSH